MKETYNYSPLTTVVVLLALFLAYIFFDQILPMLKKDAAETYPQAKRKPTKAEIRKRKEIDRMPEELENAAKVINLDNHENAIS